MSGTSQHEGYRRSRTREEGRIAGGGPGEDRKATWKAHVCPRYTSQPPARPCAPTTGKRYCICSTEILVIFLLHKAATLCFSHSTSGDALFFSHLRLLNRQPASFSSSNPKHSTTPQPLYINVTTVQMGLKQNQTTLPIYVSSSCFQ